MNETGIPHLRRYCHLLTATSHRKSALRHLRAIKGLVHLLRNTIDILSEEAEKDQGGVRIRWESRLMRNISPGEKHVLLSNAASSGVAARLRKVGLSISKTLFSEPRHMPSQEFTIIIDGNLHRLKGCLKAGLEEKCRRGSALVWYHLRWLSPHTNGHLAGCTTCGREYRQISRPSQKAFLADDQSK